MHRPLLDATKICIQQPLRSHVMKLRYLWKETFGDSDAFLDIFFDTAFSIKRSMCVTCNDSVIGALYWFDCMFLNQKIAYIYAVATAKEFRGQGICHSLMEHTHNHLREQGYTGVILSPAETSLFEFYKKMGYTTCAYTSELQFTDDTLYAFENTDIELEKINKLEFAKLRRDFLPPAAVLQENENLDFLETQADFYKGNDFLLTAQKNDSYLNGIEFLGDTSVIPSIIRNLNCTSGSFRTIGTKKPLAMYLPLTDFEYTPNYIGFIFD